MANPFQVVAGRVTGSGTSRAVTVANATSSGDTLVVLVSVNNTTCIPSACADSKSNVYTLDKSFTTTQPTMYMYRSPGATGGAGSTATAALTTSDTVTITTNAVSGNVSINVTDVPGIGAVDQTATIATGTSTTPSVSVTPGHDSETLISCFVTANGGGAPTVNNSFTDLTALHGGTDAYNDTAYKVLGAGTSGNSQTSTQTIVSAAWRAGMWSFQAGASPQTVSLTVAQEAIAAPVPTLGVSLSLPVATVAIAAPTPTVSVPSGAFTFVGSSSFNTGSVSSETVDVPAGVADGDFLLVMATSFISSPFDNISGWTTLYNQAAGTAASDQFYLAYRVASSEPSSYNLTAAGSNMWPAGWMIAVRGGDTSSPVLGNALQTNGSRQTTLPPPSYSESAGTSLLIYGYGGVNLSGSGSNGLTLPSPGNLLSGSSTGTINDSSGGADYGSLCCTDSTGPGSATASTAVDEVNFVVELAVAASAASVSLPVAQEAIAALVPALSESLSLPVAQEAIAAQTPTLGASLALTVAQEAIAAPAPTVAAGAVSVSLPVAQEAIVALAPSAGFSASLTVAQEAIAAPAPTVATGALSVALPVAQEAILAPVPSVAAGGVSVALTVAQEAIAAPVPTPTVGAVSVALPVALEAIAAPAPSIGVVAELSLPVAQVEITAYILVQSGPSAGLTTAQAGVTAWPPYVYTGPPKMPMGSTVHTP